MWAVYWSIFGSTLWVLRYTNGQRELGDVDLGCPQGSYLHGNYCYVVSPIFVTYEDAEIMCETGGGLLAPIKDMETQNFLHKLRVRKFLHRYWFGLNDKKTEGEWIYSDNTRMSGFSKWHRGEPNNFGKNQHCVNMWLERHLEWDDEDCARKMLYVCEYNDVNCTDQFPSYGRSCYEISQDVASYDEADIICQQNGGMLATIKTEGTFNFLKSIIYADRFWLKMSDKQMQSLLRDQSNKVSWVIDTWIGTRFRNGEWTHSDGTPVVFTNWAPGEPYNVRNQEDCVKLGQLWNDVQCDLRHGFICQYPVTATSKFPPSSADCTLTSDVDREQVLPPRGLESRVASSSAIHDTTSMTSEIHLGVAQFSIVLVGSAFLGMLVVALSFIAVVRLRRRHQSAQSLRDDQDLEILGEPEVEDYS